MKIDKMKLYRLLLILAAAGFYIAAAVFYLTDQEGLGGIWDLCWGSAFLSLFSRSFRRWF